jgi:hypothetical protein
MWEIFFWLTAALLFIPLPFKILGYISGKDDSPLKVKVEEVGNALLLMLGLVPFYGFISDERFGATIVWQIWLILAVIMSFISIFRSPKISYAKEKIGLVQTRLVLLFSTLFFLPMLIAVYKYAF